MERIDKLGVERNQKHARPAGAALRRVLALAFAVAAASAASPAQMTSSASSASDPFLGSVTIARVVPQALHLSLDQALDMALQQNLGLVLQQQSQRSTEAETLTAFNSLMPAISAQALTSVQQFDLVALGFKPSLLAKAGPGLHVSPIVKLDVTSAQVNLSQVLFNLTDFELYRTAKQDVAAAQLNTLNARGTVVVGVADAYLQVLADQAQVDNAKALLAADDLFLQQTRDQDQAGVATHLDVLRAQVQDQTQQQVLVEAQVAVDKDKIALKRRIGVDPAQAIQLTDPAPYDELATLSLNEAKTIAFGRRKDYLAVLAQIRALQSERKAVRYERLPSLSFNGNYGVTGVTHGLYHGTFYAAGNLDFPIFKEAQLRGDREVVDAQLNGMMQRAGDLRVAIDGQIRSSLLDVKAANQLVAVERSQVELAKEEVDQATQRFQAGVSDDLPVVQAQATLANAQSNLVNGLYQYNQSKLALARNTGVVETEYRDYLGKSPEKP